MSRPVGRYFASVISKIQELKRQENIVLDPDLKARLRMSLIARIGGASVSQFATVPISKTQEVPVSIQKIMSARFNPAEAASPMLSQVFPEEQELPGESGPVESILDKEVEDGSGLNPGFAEVTEESGFIESFMKWKYQLALIPAFLLVVVVVLAVRRLPVDFSSKTQEVGGEQSQIAQSVQTGQVSQQTEVVQAEGVTQSQQAQIALTQSQQAGIAQPIQSQTQPQQAQTGLAQPQAGAQVKPLSQLLPNPNEGFTQNGQSVPSYTQSLNTPAATAPSQPVANTQNQPVTAPRVQTPGPEVVVPATTSDPLDILKINNLVDVKVYYKNDFIDVQKSLFEQKNLIPLLTNTSFSYVIVRDGGSGKTSVDVYKNGGTCVRYDYVYNSRLNIWSRVGVVTAPVQALIPATTTTTTTTAQPTLQTTQPVPVPTTVAPQPQQTFIPYQIIQGPSFEYTLSQNPVINYTRVNP